MRFIGKYLYLGLIMFVCTFAFGQKDKSLKRDTPPPLFLAGDTTEVPKAKKKVKRNGYWGYKVRRGFIKTGQGKRLTVEKFSFLKKYVEPDKYVMEKYWFDPVKRKLMTGKDVDNKKYQQKILHGPYKKKIADVLVEEGWFYLGVKHGRWEKYSNSNILLEKHKYNKGFLHESKIEYFDAGGKDIKEVIPYEYGEKNGKYYRYHPNGELAEEGTYKFDKKIGVWREYYDFKKRRKKELEYPRDPFVEPNEPISVKEYDKQGKQLSGTEIKAAEAEDSLDSGTEDED
jgi:antitoxin component YwqK of YwqJK toxin-antitoxin module